MVVECRFLTLQLESFMNITITPVIKIGGMGALAYGFGVFTKVNAVNIAIAWTVAEFAVQAFLYITSRYKNDGEDDPYHLECPLRSVIGALTCLYLSEHHKITKTVHTVLLMAVFNVVPDIVNRLVKAITLGIETKKRNARGH